MGHKHSADRNTADGDKRWILDVAAAVSGSVLSALPIFLIASLAPQIRDTLQFGVSTLGAIIALYYLCAALGSVPLSRVVEKLGATLSMRIGAAITGVLLLLQAVLARGLPSLALLVALAGLASTAIQPATNLFLIRRMPSDHRGLAFGFKQAAVPLAVVLSGLAVPALALHFGWRWTLAVGGLLALVISVCMPRAQLSAAARKARAPIPPLARHDVIYLLILTVGFTLGIAAASSLSTFAVTALAANGLDYATAGIFVSLGGLVAATTRATAGIQADHRIRAPFKVIAAMLFLGACAYALVALASSMTLTMLLLPALLFAFAAGWGWNGLFSFGVATKFPVQAARATAVTSIGGRSGGVIGPFLFGIIATHASYGWAWLCAALSAAIGAAITLLAQWYAHRHHAA